MIKINIVKENGVRDIKRSAFWQDLVNKMAFISEHGKLLSDFDLDLFNYLAKEDGVPVEFRPDSIYINGSLV